MFQVGLLMAVFALLPVLALTRGQGGLRALVPVHTRLVAARAVLTAGCCHLAWNAFAHLYPMTEAYAILFASPMIITALSALVLGEDVGAPLVRDITGFVGVLIMLDPTFSSLGGADGGARCLLRIGLLPDPAQLGGPRGKAHRSWRHSSSPWVCPQRPASHSWVTRLRANSRWLSPGCCSVPDRPVSCSPRETPAALVAPFQYTQMIWAMIFRILLFGDMPAANLFVGLAIVIASGLFIVWRETVRARPVAVGGGRGEVTARAARVPVEA
ncbi:MAG: hypothetical protein R3C97_17005 [Geminicoccaceae bacterium]